MKKAGETYTNGQPVSTQDGDVLTFFFEDGSVQTEQHFEHGRRVKSPPAPEA